LVSRHPAIQTTGLLTLAPAGLSPAEHASLLWTHNRTCRSPASGSPTGFIVRAGQAIRLVAARATFHDCNSCKQFEAGAVPKHKEVGALAQKVTTET